MGRNARMQWRSAVLSQDGPSGVNARIVGVALAEFANGSTMMAWPSNAQLGACVDLSISSVQRALRVLESSGWVEKVAAGGVPGGPKTTRWRLSTPVNLTDVGNPDPGQSDLGPGPVDNSDPGHTEGGSEPVDNSDPGQPDTPPRSNRTPTPVSLTPEPVRTSFEPEGVTRSNHLQGDLVQRGSRTELEAALDPIRDRHGTAVLTEALQTLHDDQRSYRWPRELAAALDPICSTIAARHREAITRQRTAPDPTAITGQAARTRAAAARDALRTPPPGVAL